MPPQPRHRPQHDSRDCRGNLRAGICEHPDIRWDMRPGRPQRSRPQNRQRPRISRQVQVAEPHTIPARLRCRPARKGEPEIASLQLVAESAPSLIPGDDFRSTAIKIVKAAIELSLLRVSETNRIGLRAKTVPEVANELKTLFRGQLRDVDSRDAHDAMIRPSPSRNHPSARCLRRLRRAGIRSVLTSRPVEA